MTAYELLWLYARLRGIPEAEIKDAVDKEIKRMDLAKHAKNTCGTYRYACISYLITLFKILVVEINVNLTQLLPLLVALRLYCW